MEVEVEIEPTIDIEARLKIEHWGKDEDAADAQTKYTLIRQMKMGVEMLMEVEMDMKMEMKMVMEI